MERVLTIVGASARAAAASAVRAGFVVHAADLFADADLRRCCHARQVADYPAGFEDVVSGPQAGGWMYTGALENYPTLVDRLAKIRPLWGNDAGVLRRARNPQGVENVLHANGLACPAAARQADSLPRDGSWLRKSLRSAGGAHVTVWEGNAAYESPGDEFYFQKRIDGVPCSAVYVAAAGRAVLLGVTRQLIGAAWTGAQGFQYCGSIGPLALPAMVEANFARIGAVLAREFDLTGLFGIDAIVNDEGAWPVEVNPRYTASTELLEGATGRHAIDLHVAACAEGRLPNVAVRAQSGTFGKAILFASARFVVSAKLDALFSERGGQRPAAMADLPIVGTTIEAGWPIVTVVAASADEPQVLQKLKQQAAEVRALIPG